ncbi:uncharacterized protein LOC141917753 isoform X1 [Strix aluco]|uniref:uncharacterized protein LOC141917753 isoform X1 n=1 Tax=Strix aluco TaxID=111821 RepID=UPI003DA44300
MVIEANRITFATRYVRRPPKMPPIYKSNPGGMERVVKISHYEVKKGCDRGLRNRTRSTKQHRLRSNNEQASIHNRRAGQTKTTFDIILVRLTSKLLPDWEKNNIMDHLMIVEGLEMIPKDISWALSCIQAQMWTQIVISNILREGEEGILPTEIRKIIWDKAKPQERELQSWWKLVNFTYERQDDKIIAFVLTVVEAAQHSIYPVASIGLNHGGMIISPVGHRGWAWKQGDKWQAINTELCINMGQQGYVCEGNSIQAEDMCLDTHQKECHFEIQSSINNDTVMIYIGEGCICLRTLCTSVLIDGYHREEIGNYSNHCVCNFTKIEGCDFCLYCPSTNLSDNRIRLCLNSKNRSCLYRNEFG